MDRIRVIKEQQEEYPDRLRFLEKKPQQLYVWGEVPRDDQPSVAIVGARECSPYGKKMAYEYAKSLAQEGVAVISGLARGVDVCAHTGALEGNGKTYGVLGCGVDICYPSSNRAIYERMKNQGGLISEFENQTPPLAYHFPLRNRIISGLADAVLVIEARKKSGSLITVDYALEQGKTVFALPGRASDELSIGCNQLIYQGAVPAWNVEVILEEVLTSGFRKEINPDWKEKNGLGLASEDDLVYSCLDLTPKSMSRLQDETGYSTGKLLTILLQLQWKGLIKEIWKNYYIRAT